MYDRYTYRGKALSDQHVTPGTWVYGGLFKAEDGCWIVRLAPGEFETGIIQHIRIDPDTVGQCTGLVDESGVAIFEGDIMRDKDGDMTTTVEYEQKYSGFFWGVGGNEIIGNRWDTPELLEVKSDV